MSARGNEWLLEALTSGATSGVTAAGAQQLFVASSIVQQRASSRAGQARRSAHRHRRLATLLALGVLVLGAVGYVMSQRDLNVTVEVAYGGEPPATSTTTTLPALCSTEAVAQRLRDSLPVFGGWAARRYSLLTAAQLGCPDEDFGPDWYGEIVAWSFVGGQFRRALLVVDPAGDAIAVEDAFRGPVIGFIKTQEVIRIAEVLNRGTKMVLLTLRDDGCSVVYRDRAGGPVIEVPESVAMPILALWLQRQQVSYLADDERSDARVFRMLFSGTGMDWITLTLDGAGDVVLPPQFNQLGRITVCPEGAAIAALRGAPTPG